MFNAHHREAGVNRQRTGGRRLDLCRIGGAGVPASLSRRRSPVQVRYVALVPYSLQRGKRRWVCGIFARLAQRESAPFTPERSQVRILY